MPIEIDPSIGDSNVIDMSACPTEEIRQVSAAMPIIRSTKDKFDRQVTCSIKTIRFKPLKQFKYFED